MSRPHRALIELAAGRPLPSVPTEEAEGLVTSALEHRMAGLLWSRLSADEVALPRETVRRLAYEDLRSQGHNLRLWRVLSSVVQRLADIGVAVASAKGVAAEGRWYSRLGERPCNDIDVLLAPEDVARIDDVVHCLKPDHFMRTDIGHLVRSGTLQSIDLTVDDVEVDLHADLLKIEIPTRQPEVLWSRQEAVQGPEGIRVHAVDGEISLIHFLLHLNKDRFSFLLGYADVARLVAGGDLDWAFVDNFLRREGLRVPAYQALDEVVQALRLDPPVAVTGLGWRAAAWQALWRPQRRLTGRRGAAGQAHRQFWIPWLVHGRANEALRWWVRRRLFPPVALLPVYYPRTRGPYLWRLVSGRAMRIRERRRVLRSVDTPPEDRPQTSGRYKTFPPKWSHIQVPLSSRGAARAALALYSPCQPAGYAIRDAAWGLVRTLGPRALPSRSRPLTSPPPDEVWEQLLAIWSRTLGSFDDVAVYGRPQTGRSGFAALLVRQGRPFAFVRVRRDDVSFFRREARALAALTARDLPFWHPEPLGEGTTGGWSFLAMTALPPQRHTAAGYAAVRPLADELAAALEVLPRSQAVPSHWRPAHGDFTPWNCRNLQDGRVAIVDWEDAGWAPPGTDDVLFRASAATLGGDGDPGTGPLEAIEYWQERLRARVADRPEEPATQQMAQKMARMRGVAPLAPRKER